MNTPQGETVTESINKIQERWNITEVRKPPVLEAKSPGIPHINDVLTDYDNFSKDFKDGASIQFSCEVSQDVPTKDRHAAMDIHFGMKFLGIFTKLAIF